MVIVRQAAARSPSGASARHMWSPTRSASQRRTRFTSPRPRSNSWDGQVVISDAGQSSKLALAANATQVMAKRSRTIPRIRSANANPVCDAQSSPRVHFRRHASQALFPLHRREITHMPIKFMSRSAAGRPLRILCYGDSLTAGFCHSGVHFEPYGRTLANELGVMGFQCEVVVSGHSGKTAEEMVAALNTCLVDAVDLEGKGLARILDEDALPDLAIIMAGTNDLGKGLTIGAIAQNIAYLHAACHRRGVATIALVPPPAPCMPPKRESDRMRLRTLMEEWAAGELGVEAVVDPGLWVPLNGGPGVWDSDGLHLCPSGSASLGQRLALQAAKAASDEVRAALLRATLGEEKAGAARAPPALATRPSLAFTARQTLSRHTSAILFSTFACSVSGARIAMAPVGSVALIRA